MCMADGGDNPEFGSTVERTARKGHICGECNRVIRIGEKYDYFAGKFDGNFYDAKVCVHCQVAMRWLSQNCGGYVFEMIIEDLEEHASEYPKLAYGLLRIVVGARRRWRSFESDGVLLPIPEIPKSIESFVKEEAAHA